MLCVLICKGSDSAGSWSVGRVTVCVPCLQLQWGIEHQTCHDIVSPKACRRAHVFCLGWFATLLLIISWIPCYVASLEKSWTFSVPSSVATGWILIGV